MLSPLLSTLWLFGAGSIAGIVLGLRARARIRASRQRGTRLALAGITLGWAGLIGTVFLIVQQAGV
ncbi:MAG: DUF4190 domain-containing protein [Frankia sp.]|nr:DUF4190 domain-containing protein [Frankia sp.]